MVNELNVVTLYNSIIKSVTKTSILSNIADIMAKITLDKPLSTKYQSKSAFTGSFLIDSSIGFIKDITKNFSRGLFVADYDVGKYIPYLASFALGGLKSCYTGKEFILVGSVRSVLSEISKDYKIEPQLGIIDSYGTNVLVEATAQLTGILASKMLGDKVIKTKWDTESILVTTVFMTVAWPLYEKLNDYLKYQKTDVSPNFETNTSLDSNVSNIYKSGILYNNYNEIEL